MFCIWLLPWWLAIFLFKKYKKNELAASKILFPLNFIWPPVFTSTRNSLQRFKTIKFINWFWWSHKNCRFRFIEIKFRSFIINIFILWKCLIHASWNDFEVFFLIILDLAILLELIIIHLEHFCISLLQGCHHSIHVIKTK